MSDIHPTAIIEPHASVHPTAVVGPYTIIRNGVVLEDGVEIGSHCDLGLPTDLAREQSLLIGPGSIIRSHNRFYIGSDFSKGITTGHGATVRENTVAGARFQLGTLADVEGDCVIGDDVRTHNNVLITKNSVIGNFVWLSMFVNLTDDPHPPSEIRMGVTICDYAMLASRVTILPGVKIGEGALVGAASLVHDDVPPWTIAAGVPAVLRGPVSRIPMRDGSGKPAYPWMRHFHRGYPPEVVERWRQKYNGEHE